MAILILLIALVITSGTVLLWKIAKFDWLEKLSGALILALPFERIPSLDAGGVNIRPSQVIVLIGLWLFVVLWAKKDARLSEIKINSINWFLGLFLIVGLPSAFFVIDDKRFLVTMVATLIAFGAAFLTSNFAKNIPNKLNYLLVIMFFVALFGIYQFLGDLGGLSPLLTGLREQYTKKVFGIPRVQGTALEPLYFAGMLFFPIIYLLVNILAKRQIWFLNLKIKRINYILLVLFVLVFVLTLSKGAYVVIVLSVILLLAFAYQKLNIFSIIKTMAKFFVATFTLIGILVLFSKNFSLLITSLVINFFETITFQFASSIERLNFFNAALDLLPNNILFGIGSGQYGAWIKLTNLINLPIQDQAGYLIVNNVYLEVWLEFGFLALLALIALLAWPIYKNIKTLNKEELWNTKINVARITVMFTLISYFIQWMTFSPIFIMPIFILLGVAANLAETKE